MFRVNSFSPFVQKLASAEIVAEDEIPNASMNSENQKEPLAQSQSEFCEYVNQELKKIRSEKLRKYRSIFDPRDGNCYEAELVQLHSGKSSREQLRKIYEKMENCIIEEDKLNPPELPLTTPYPSQTLPNEEEFQHPPPSQTRLLI